MFNNRGRLTRSNPLADKRENETRKKGLQEKAGVSINHDNSDELFDMMQGHL